VGKDIKGDTMSKQNTYKVTINERVKWVQVITCVDEESAKMIAYQNLLTRQGSPTQTSNGFDPSNIDVEQVKDA
jgi:hypothetical protein